MRKIFISHPFNADQEVNMAKITRICRTIADQFDDVLPVSPIHAFSYLDEAIHRGLALTYCLELLSSCDELWLFGEWEHSEGCQLEYERACELGLRVDVYN